jgi:hypothetical protein
VKIGCAGVLCAGVLGAYFLLCEVPKIVWWQEKAGEDLHSPSSLTAKQRARQKQSKAIFQPVNNTLISTCLAYISYIFS